MNLQQPRRKRGVILTLQGFHKLHTAKCQAESRENSDQRYTLEKLSLRTGLDPDTLIKVFRCEVGVDHRTLNYCFKAFNLALEPGDYQLPPTGKRSQNLEFPIPNCIDWDDAPDVSIFYGRAEELATLKQWIISDRCRLVTLLGMGGSGKTWLSVKLATQIQEQFKFVIRRSLCNAPPIKDMLADLIRFFSTAPETDLPKTLDGRISQLIHYLKDTRCLLVLDNVETILQDGSVNQDVGQYRQGYEGYGQLFRQIGETPHQSCLVLTSREKPKQIGRQEGKTLPVRVLQLKGLQVIEVKAMFKGKGYFWGSPIDWKKLIERYAGNPLVLNIVATTIQNLFDGSIAEFLNQETAVFGEIRHWLGQYLLRLSDTEKQIINWLAINYQPASFSEIREKISLLVPPQQLLEALEFLQERSLLEKKATLFSLLPMIREYLKDELIETQISSDMKSRPSHKNVPQMQSVKKVTSNLIFQR